MIEGHRAARLTWLHGQRGRRLSATLGVDAANARPRALSADKALRQRASGPRPLRPRGPRRRLLRPPRPQRRRQDDAHQRGVQPHPRHERRRPRLRHAASRARRAAHGRPRRAGREPRPLPRRRGDAALPRRLLRHGPRDGAAPRHGDDGRLRPAREGRRARPAAERRHAPAPAPRPCAHARAAPGHPRRADRGRGLRAAPRAVGVHQAPAPGGHDDPPHHPLPRGGRGALRGDRHHPRRPAAGARHRRRAARGLRGRLDRRRLRQGDGVVSELVARRRGLIALSVRETHRVLKLWTQTVAAPILSSFLFIAVFGLSLGGRIKHIDGVPYEVFIVPGLIAMAMIQATYANNSASVFQARFDRYLNDVLAAPMRPWEINLALSIGGVVRALLIGGGPPVCALAVVDVPIRHPLELVVAVALALVLFSSFGVIVGIYAHSWDHTAFVTNIVILPLSFLGGVFYSVDTLPSPWHEISHANPIFYLTNAVRYGFLGTSDVSVALSLGVTAAIAGACVAWSCWLFATGRRLKP